MAKGIRVENLSMNYGAVQVLKDLNIEIAESEFLVLLGASGCGKSTLLNAIAGLLNVSGGKIYIGDRNVTWDEPKDRGIGMVFQSYALYPQMTVEKNLSFGLRMLGVDKAEISKRVEETARMLQLSNLLKRKPRELSGGQRQRVAIGRALVRKTGVFLFDEPLSNLDAKLRAELRTELRRLHDQLKATIVYVTHDQIEAMTLADRVAVMKGGVVEQIGPPTSIYRSPANIFVADFIGSPGMNFFKGHLRINNDRSEFVGDGFSLTLNEYSNERPLSDGLEVTLGVRPEHVRLERNGHELGFKSQVASVEHMGATNLIWVSLGNESLSIVVEDDQSIDDLHNVEFSISADKVSLFQKSDGMRI